MTPPGRGVLTPAQVAATLDTIAAVQLADGMVPWFPDGHADPWNHVEAAMALATGGRRAEADRAFDWLVATQLPSGAWHRYHVVGGVEDATLDANVCAYVATGVWHSWLLTADTAFLEAMWPVVEAAIDFVLGLQTRRGEIVWALHPDGTPWPFALLTGSSSICHSLGCAIAVAHRLGHERPHWERAAARLAHVVATVPDAFAPKDRWAMDWYYPVLAGVLTGQAADDRLAGRADEFVMPGEGVRCVADRPWVTAAETCECAMAHAAADRHDEAADLFAWAQRLRDDDGAYFTGLALPERVHFPGGERSTYTAAAVVLAADALSATTAASGLFVGRHHHTGHQPASPAGGHPTQHP